MELECVTVPRPNTINEEDDSKQLVTTLFVKEEPECKIEEQYVMKDRFFQPDLNNIRVKDEPNISPESQSNLTVDVEVTCLTEKTIKEELVALDGESGVTAESHFITDHGNQFEVCITKESCSSPSVDISIVSDEDPQDYKIRKKEYKKSSLASQIFIDMDKNSMKNKTNYKINDEEIICKTCGILSPSLCTYLKHRQKHLLEKPYMCEICEKEFNSKYLLSNHERIHTGEKPYACVVCDKRFTEIVNLNRHKRTHSGDKPYKCNVCQKEFSLKHNLTPHMRTHTNERPFECEICKMRFPHPSDLRRHQRSHTGEKRFSCDICKKSFARKHYLPYHMQSHNKERPVSCEICEKKFLSIYDCKKHLKIHMTKRNCFICHICKDSFTHKRHLTKHLQQNHLKTSK